MRVSYSLNESLDRFPLEMVVRELPEYLRIAQHHHCVGSFNNGKRNISSFLGADGIVMDVDNDGEDIYTPEQVHEVIPAQCFIVYSRHHMQQKEDKSPRPRFHVYYPLSKVIRSADEIGSLKRALCDVCPAFDTAAVDAARLIFGVSQPSGTAFDGDCVDVILDGKPASGFTQAIAAKRTITAGSRNVTLFKIALRILNKHDANTGYGLFLSEATRCTPPLPDREVHAIWINALRYAAKDAKDAKDAKSETVKTPRKVKPRLTLRALETELSARNVSVRYDMVTKQLKVSDFSPDDEVLPSEYVKLSPDERELHRTSLLLDYIDGTLSAQYSFNRDLLSSLISNLARLNSYVAPLELISAEPWDNVDRFEQLCDLFTVDMSVDVPWRMYLKKWLIQCIALLHNTVGHIGADTCLVLQGNQGIRKTSFFRRLSLRPEWFREGHILDMHIKDSIIQAVSCWITELGELDSTLVKEQSSLKAFLTSNNDTYRVPYARIETKSPRITSFCATVNPREFLRDMTGSRRFLVIPVVDISRKIFDYDDAFFLGVWRQALNWYRIGDDWRLNELEQQSSERANQSYRAVLPYQDDILQLYDFDAPLIEWSEKTSGQVERELGLMGEARRIGRALGALTRIDTRVTVRVGHARVNYFRMPPLRTHWGSPSEK